MLEVVTLVVGEFLTCCYLVRKIDVPAVMVVDPGADGERILAEIEKREMDVATILNTHGHIDHIAANETLKKAFPEAELVIGKGDARMLTSSIRNLSVFFLKRIKSPPADRTVSEGDIIRIGDAEGVVLDTPGHSPGGISLYVSAEENNGTPILLSGDALFHMGIGRTDFPGGNFDQLVRSVREKLLSLPEETIVYPGHGEPTTVGIEAASNPFVALRTKGT